MHDSVPEIILAALYWARPNINDITITSRKSEMQNSEWWKSYNGCQEIIIFTQVMILSTVYDSGKTHSSSLIMKDVLLDMVWYGFCF